MWYNSNMSPIISLGKTFLSCFVLDYVYPIYIFSSVDKWLFSIIKINFNNDKTFNGMVIDKSREITNNWLNFLLQIIDKSFVFVPLWIKRRYYVLVYVGKLWPPNFGIIFIRCLLYTPIYLIFTLISFLHTHPLVFSVHGLVKHARSAWIHYNTQSLIWHNWWKMGAPDYFPQIKDLNTRANYCE